MEYLDKIWTQACDDPETNQPFTGINDADFIQSLSFIKSNPLLLAHKIKARNVKLKTTEKNDTIPGFRILPTNPNTKISKLHHRLLISMYFQKNGPKSRRMMIECSNLKSLVEDEQQQYLKFALEKWQQGGMMLLNEPRDNFCDLFESIFTHKYDRITRYAQFYYKNSIGMVPLKLSDDEKFTFTEGDVVFEQGFINHIQLPPIGRKKLNLDVERIVKRVKPEDFVRENTPSLLRDPVCDRIVSEHHPHVVICSSALKTLFNCDLDVDWTIPIRIENTGKTIILDKPLPCKTITHPAIARWLHKKAMKFQYSKRISMTLENPSVSYESDELQTNVQYKLWYFAPEQQAIGLNKKQFKRLNVIVRSKIHGLDNPKSPNFISITPKLEYQLDYGVECQGKSELFKQWIHTLIRPKSKIVQVFIDPCTSELIHVKSFTNHDIGAEMWRVYGVNLKDDLACLHNLFACLLTHAPGEYLLRHEKINQSFAELLGVSEIGGLVTTFDLHQLYASRKLRVEKEPSVWKPIDSTIFLPINRYLECFPGLFQGHLRRKKIRSNEKKRQNRREKTNVKKCDSKKMDVSTSSDDVTAYF